MPNDPHPVPPPVESEPAQHHGTFAEGEADPKTYPEDEHVGTFAEGEADPEAHPEDEHVGTFGER
jgi:hypothetical protein